MNLINYFQPSEKVKILRSNQVQVLDDLSQLLVAGHKHIELQAPPGSGKSEIANILMNWAQDNCMNSLVCSPQNLMVDQYQRSNFADLVTLKGREHYECLVGRNNAGVGYCRQKLCPDKKERHCKTSPYGKCKSCICRECIYKKAFRAFKDSTKANTNFALFMKHVHNEPSLIIIDEAGEIEGTIRDFYAIVVQQLFKDTSFPGILVELEEYKKKQELYLASLAGDFTERALKESDKVLRIIENIEFLHDDWEANRQPWCVSIDPRLGQTKIEPVLIERFLPEIFGEAIVIMMSATPPHFAGYQRIEVNSIFPKESRQWKYVPYCGSMVSRDRDVTIPKVAKWLSKLFGKTVVHARSYPTGERLYVELSKLGIRPYLQTNNNSSVEGYSRYDIVDAFLTSKDIDQIAILTNQTVGLDLWQPEVLNNVMFVPWVNNTEPINIAKNALLGKSWQDQIMANELIQGMARIFRNEKPGIYKGKEVWKRSYFVDASFGRWYLKNKMLFPKDFREAELL